MTDKAKNSGYFADNSDLSEADRQLMDAAAYLDLEGVQQAVRNGANVNALDGGESALTVAVMACPQDHLRTDDPDFGEKFAQPDYPLDLRLRIIDWLIEHGADINLFDVGGLAPLSMAVLRHNPELVCQLLKRGADPTSDQFPYEHEYVESTAAFYAGGELHIVHKDSREYVDAWEISVTVDAAIIDWRVAHGESLREILTNPADGRLWLCRTDAAYMVALAWNRLDADLLEPHLSDHVIYESQHVFESLRGKADVLEYLNNKMRTIRDHGDNARVLAEIGVSRLGPSTILRQGCNLSTAAVLLIGSNEGKIDRIDVRGIAPRPESIRGTGIFPGKLATTSGLFQPKSR